MTQTLCWSTTIAHIFLFTLVFTTYDVVAQEVGNGIVFYG